MLVIDFSRARHRRARLWGVHINFLWKNQLLVMKIQQIIVQKTKNKWKTTSATDSHWKPEEKTFSKHRKSSLKVFLFVSCEQIVRR